MANSLLLERDTSEVVGPTRVRDDAELNRCPELLLPADETWLLESSSSSRDVAIEAVPVLVPGESSVGLSSEVAPPPPPPTGTTADEGEPRAPIPPPPPPPMVAMAELGLVPVDIVAHVGISAEFGLAGSIENRADEVGVEPEAAAVLP